MIALRHDKLVIRFPHIENEVGFEIDFQRTLRIPDDDRHHNLPPGMGRFPLRHIEDFDLETSEHRKGRGGLIMPMFQTDALWLNFSSISQSRMNLPVALKIGAGKINAVSGLKWEEGLSQTPQNYVVIPDQPWLDGFNVGKGIVRQFVAMPLGQGYTVEEQIDPESDVGGIQIEAIPMKKEFFEKIQSKRGDLSFAEPYALMSCSSPEMEMGLGMGGSMRQEIFDDEYGLEAWDIENSQRCFVMLTNAEQWINITGEEPPLSPISAAQYTDAGLPWFDFYGGDKKAIDGAKTLGRIKSIKQLSDQKRTSVWPSEKPVVSPVVKTIGKGKVSDGSW
jgi:hypothetical protein